MKTSSSDKNSSIGTGSGKGLRSGQQIPSQPVVPRSLSNFIQNQREESQNGHLNSLLNGHLNGNSNCNLSAFTESDDTYDEMRVMSIRDHLFAQLDVLRVQKRNLRQVPMYDTYKELYGSQQKLLTCLNGRTTYPRSVAYSALKLERNFKYLC